MGAALQIKYKSSVTLGQTLTAAGFPTAPPSLQPLSSNYFLESDCFPILLKIMAINTLALEKSETHPNKDLDEAYFQVLYVTQMNC